MNLYSNNKGVVDFNKEKFKIACAPGAIVSEFYFDGASGRKCNLFPRDLEVFGSFWEVKKKKTS